MDRREILGMLGATAMGASALPAMGQHDHSGHAAGAHKSLADAASACSTAADACVTHCVDMLAGGDKSLQYCAATSREVATVCSGLQSLAAQNSPHLASYAKVAAEICKDCEAECRKHSQHAVCKACGDSCAACAAECEKVA